MNLVARVGEKIWGIFANFQKKGVEKNRDWHDWSILLPKMDQHKNQFVYVFFFPWRGEKVRSARLVLYL